MPLDRESRELLLAAAERPPRSSPARIAQLASAIRDWDGVVATALQHRIGSLLFSRLNEASARIPAAAEEQLRTEYQRNLVRSLTNAGELISVLECFRREGIQALPFKGVVLAASAYGDLTSRPAGDLDLLIHLRDLRAATDLILARGYELTTAVPDRESAARHHYYEHHFERGADGMVLELRWRLELTQPRYRRNLGMDWAWPGHRVVQVAGAAVPEMRPEIGLLALAMHASKHLWSRLIWICDLAQLIAVSPSLNWDELIAEARRTGLRRALAVGVLLAHDLAAASVPEAVLRRFNSDATAQRLARHFSEHLLDSPGMPPMGGMPYNLQVLAWPDRLRFAFSPGLVRPNERDRDFLPLPKLLYPLYLLVRPLRLLLDRSPR